MHNRPDSHLPRPSQISDVLGIGTDTPRLWQADELAAIFRHQMASPVVFDLESVGVSSAKKLARLSEAQGLVLKSFADLFHHVSPPLELLRLTKDFAKANRDHPESVLPSDIASVLYYASIAAALVRCNARITRLSNDELQKAFQWAGSQVWVDDPMRDLFKKALQLVTTGGQVT